MEGRGGDWRGGGCESCENTGRVEDGESKDGEEDFWSNLLWREKRQAKTNKDREITA